MKTAYRKLFSILSLLSLTVASIALSIVAAPVGNAQVQGLSVDFAAADERTYDHLVGGGQWNLGDINADISRELNATNFSCGEIVSYLVNFTANGSQEILDLQPFTVRSQFVFDMDTSGQPGAALGQVVGVAIDQTDPAQKGDKESVATLVGTSTTGNMFEKLAKLNATIDLTDIDSGDTIIVRIDVKLFCQFGERPTGTLDGRFLASEMIFRNGSTPVNPTEKIQVGAKTVPMKNLNEVAIPRLVLSKTVTTETGLCSTSVETLLIAPDQTVKYCYAVTSASNGGSNPAGPIYNLSVITDDGGQYASFDLPITTGLSDQDGDGTLDDLAPGATAYASITKTFDGDQDSQILNTATVYGLDSIINPTRIDASDTALVNVDAPEDAPAITVSKLTNGADGSTISAGSSVTWTYAVTNTGNVALTDLSVSDSQAGVSVTCPSTTLAVGETVTCSATGTAIAGDYSNTGTASANYGSTPVTASDTSSYFGSAPAITVSKLTNGADGSTISAGSSVTWTYAVTNTGNVALTDLSVSDSQAGVSVTCPSTTLAVGETVTCSATGTAIAGDYSNTGTASANYGSTPVTASDTSSYFGSAPAITVSKLTNGADGSTISAGSSVTWTYAVTNTGNVALTDLSVSDSQAGVSVTCPSTTLAVGETVTCSATGTAIAGDYSNTGTASANYGSTPVTASDTSSYFGSAPAITVSKLTNGADGSTISAGSSVTWTYAVTNTGNVALTDLSVSDSQAGVSVTCPSTTLAVGETVTCSATGTAIAGDYSNTGTASANYGSTPVTASDTSSYFGSAPAITVSKLTNGADGSTISAGSSVTWTYAVTNTGNVALTDLSVSDSQAGVSVTCPSTTLAVGETVTCSATGTAIAGDYSNTGTASANYGSTPVTASDTSSYFGSAPAIDIQKTPDSQTVTVGGSVTFTITITNTGNVALVSLVVTDPLTADCARGITSLALAEVVTFTCSKTNVQDPFTNVITVDASYGATTVTDSDSAAVTVDYLPEVTLTKTADVTTVPVTGGLVDYTLRITNIGRDAFTVTSLTDTRFTLSASCLALINQVIAAGAYLECVIADVPVVYAGEPTFTNVATVVVTDPEANSDSASDDATITFGWYGRTPGFWKNKPEAWAGLGYTASQTIRSVFTVPSELLKAGVLDMIAPTGEDTLIEGLGYRGGTNLSGSFQILMRAAIAALLNEAYYGIYYPGATSTTALIAEVNAVLASKSRASYLALAGILDDWNNAIHSSLP